jgi:exodeoxyribonuclease V alpha subunit
MKTKKQTVEITARFESLRYVFQDGTPSRCIIATADMPGEYGAKTITIKGECQPNDLTAGIMYRFDGEWVEHKKYGKQFCFHSFCQPSPVTPEAIKEYLATCENIGETRAKKIYDIFGENCIEKIKQDPKILTAVKGLTEERAVLIQQSLIERESKEKLFLELRSLLSGFGLPKRIFQSLVADYGTATAEKVRENPYILMDYKGVGFLKADEVFLSTGRRRDEILRQKQCLRYIVMSDSTGSIWVPQQKAFAELSNMIQGDCIDPMRTANEAIDEELLCEIAEPNDRNKKYFGLPVYDNAEQWVVSWLSKRIGQESKFPKELFTGENKPSEHQLEQYKNATQKSVGILAGSPGTGKTWLVARIVETVQKQHDLVSVCAPTGKASLRVMESLKAQGVSITASTIHGLLSAQMNESGWNFLYNENNRLPCSFLIIDESSMIDIILLKQLLCAVDDNCNVLFVGDPDQLSPVGKGAPLRDMIAAEIPCGKLTEIRRNAGEIVKACALIRESKPIDCIGYDKSSPENLILLKTEQSIEAVMEQINSINQYEGNTDITDIQIIVAINDKSPLAKNKLNPILQNYFNHVTGSGLELESRIKKFHIDDKIICLSNGVADNAVKNSEQIRVANGDIGIVGDINKESIMVTVNHENIIVPMSSDTWGEADWDLGYAISGHKSQGSEWNTVIVLLDSSYAAGMICDRHWIYTAISRAKKRCYLLGNENTIAGMTRVSKMWNRKTLLKERFECSKWAFLDSEFQKLLQKEI